MNTFNNDYLKKIYGSSNLINKIEYNDFLELVHHMENIHGICYSDNLEENNLEENNLEENNLEENNLEENNLEENNSEKNDESLVSSKQIEELLNFHNSKKKLEPDEFSELVGSQLNSESANSFSYFIDYLKFIGNNKNIETNSTNDLTKIDQTDSLTLQSDSTTSLDSDSNSSTSNSSTSNPNPSNFKDSYSYKSDNTTLVPQDNILPSSLLEIKNKQNDKRGKINIKISPDTKFNVNVMISDSIDITID